MRKATFLFVWPLLALAAPRALQEGRERAVASRHGDGDEHVGVQDGPAPAHDGFEHGHADHDEHDDGLDHDHEHEHEHQHQHDHTTLVHSDDAAPSSHDHDHGHGNVHGHNGGHIHAGVKADAASAAAHGAAHNHGGHAAPKVVLDDADIHYWHSFPPSYLAADFRLDVDSAIFGEEFPDDWAADEAGGRKGLLLAHVASMLVAYFGILPIGEWGWRETARDTGVLTG
jgi:hypothetical protein